MSRKLFARLLAVLPVLLGASVVVFVLLHLAPGDPTDVLLGPLASPETRETVRNELGLNEPLYVQYLAWLNRTLRGDFGTSIEKSVPVLDLVIDRLKNSMILALGGGIIGLLFGVLAGSVAAHRHNSLIDRLILLVLVFAISLPPYWLAIVAIFLFAVTLHWFPTGGMYSMLGTGTLTDLLWHLTLPAIIASFVPGALVARITRTALLDTIKQDYVRTAAAKGLPPKLVFVRHVLPNALPTIVNMAGLQIGYLLVGSAVFVEIVVNWPGIGLLAYQAVLARDMPVILGIVLVTAVIFVTLNLVVDLTQFAIDPRVRET